MGRISEYDSLEQQVLFEAGESLSKEIDAEVLRGMFKELGWHEIVLQPMTKEHGDAIDDWVRDNIKGRSHWTHGLVWLFEDIKDANWFKLRWLG